MAIPNAPVGGPSGAAGANPLAAIAGRRQSPMPGSLSGGPSGPGASPITPVGAGAGNEAMARAVLAAIMPALLKALGVFPIGSKEQKALMRAYSSLAGIFGQANQQSMVPAALQQLAQGARSGNPMSAAPPPPLQPGPMPTPGGAMNAPGGAAEDGGA